MRGKGAQHIVVCFRIIGSSLQKTMRAKVQAFSGPIRGVAAGVKFKWGGGGRWGSILCRSIKDECIGEVQLMKDVDMEKIPTHDSLFEFPAQLVMLLAHMKMM